MKLKFKGQSINVLNKEIYLNENLKIISGEYENWTLSDIETKGGKPKKTRKLHRKVNKKTNKPTRRNKLE